MAKAAAMWPGVAMFWQDSGDTQNILLLNCNICGHLKEHALQFHCSFWTATISFKEGQPQTRETKQAKDHLRGPQLSYLTLNLEKKTPEPFALEWCILLSREVRDIATDARAFVGVTKSSATISGRAANQSFQERQWNREFQGCDVWFSGISTAV